MNLKNGHFDSQDVWEFSKSKISQIATNEYIASEEF